MTIGKSGTNQTFGSRLETGARSEAPNNAPINGVEVWREEN